MALTPEKREALKLARERIAEHRDCFICRALDWVEESRPELGAACTSLKCYIGRCLRPWNSLGGWQEKNGLGFRAGDQRRADRLAWIDWMLDEQKEA
ncbi:hypothetical protein [Burkholderia pseudomallei]|uniref:hypothetical protein n=1 Tax=Burkholderia pseudomallei TaxID=28450 RepID=UPI000A19FE3F|nr:hypothetical protein [Burkholderia pseudomallei]ARL90977.1 hypothetical protein BOC57_34910 [Burkholderia pseudomallei]